MQFTTLKEFEDTEEYKNFLNENPSTGILKVEAFTANEAIPITDVQILITKEIDGTNVLFYSGKTNSSGIIDNIILPAPKSVLDPSPNDIPKYTIYNLTAINEGYEIIKKYQIAMYGDTKIIQYVKMIPQVILKGDD